MAVWKYWQNLCRLNCNFPDIGLSSFVSLDRCTTCVVCLSVMDCLTRRPWLRKTRRTGTYLVIDCWHCKTRCWNPLGTSTFCVNRVCRNDALSASLPGARLSVCMLATAQLSSTRPSELPRSWPLFPPLPPRILFCHRRCVRSCLKQALKLVTLCRAGNKLRDVKA